MKKRSKKLRFWDILKKTIGIFLIILGVIGLFLPLLQGILFIILGIIILKSEKSTKFIEKDTDKLFISLRYLLLLALMFTAPLIYKLFTPLTIYPAITLLKIFFNQVFLSQSTILINSQTAIEIIPACIAASAYLLLLILNLTTPMGLKKRISALLFSFILLLILNIFRITLFSTLAYYNFSLFDLIHKISWYFLSTIFVVAIWFLTIRLFKIKQIPLYSDIKEFINKYN